MNRILQSLAALAFLALSGCAGSLTGGGASIGAAITAPPASTGGTGIVAPPAAVDILTQISQFTLDDLAAADIDAQAHQDDIAHMCYPALTQFVESVPSLDVKNVKGAFSLFQKGRDLRNMAAGGVPKYLLIGCGPLVAQVRGDILKLLGGVGTGVVTGGLLP